MITPRHARLIASRSRLFAPRTAVLIALAAVVLVVEGYLMAPYAAPAARALNHAHPAALLLAVLAEVASMMSFARLQRVMLLTAGVRVRLRDAVATVFAGNAMSVTLPGGTVASFAYTLRRMRAWGASATLAGFSLVATGALSALALTFLALTGSALVGEGIDLDGLGTLGAVAAAGIAVTVVLTRPRAMAWLACVALRAWGRLRPAGAARHRAKVNGVLAELSRLRPPLRVWARGFAFATINWGGDLLCLLAACHAVGVTPSAGSIILAYAAGMLAVASIPLLPAGLGAVEAAMVLVLGHGGVPVAPASAAVLVYRVISFGLVVLVGWLVLLAQRGRRQTAPSFEIRNQAADDETSGVEHAAARGARSARYVPPVTGGPRASLAAARCQ